MVIDNLNNETILSNQKSKPRKYFEELQVQIKRTFAYFRAMFHEDTPLFISLMVRTLRQAPWVMRSRKAS